MSILDVFTVPDSRLRQKAQPVECVDDAIRRFMDDMLETMYASKGCGLAATQVGIGKRIIVMDLKHQYPDSQPYKMVNPEILWKSEELSPFDEGCLSVPEQTAEVLRPSSVTVRYLDEWGQAHEEKVDGFFATCVQHEIDHLDGKLFIDYLSPIKRDMMIRRVKKIMR